MHKLIFPQEVEVHYIIPAMRREFAYQMKKRGVEQKKIAQLLFVSEAAVSQYLSDKRATEVQFSDYIKAAIAKETPLLIAGASFKEAGNRIITIIREEKTTCKICLQVSEHKDESCRMCFDLPTLMNTQQLVHVK
ncbi:hypothetical protein J4410_05075 [Candidatus Woesearchaeota archaeon]|nr:hypothetical protein [Candidatus Woesearchaeota archaeon]